MGRKTGTETSGWHEEFIAPGVNYNIKTALKDYPLPVPLRVSLLSRCLGWRLPPACWTLFVILILLPVPGVLALVRRTRHLVLQGNSTSRDVYSGFVATDPEPTSHVLTHLASSAGVSYTHDSECALTVLNVSKVYDDDYEKENGC